MITGLFLSTLSFGFFFNTDIVSGVHAVTTSGGRTPWLIDDLDQGSLHKFYWLLGAISAVDLLAFVAVARGYVYKEKRLAAEADIIYYIADRGIHGAALAQPPRDA